MREIDACLLDTIPSFTRMEKTTVVAHEPAAEPEMAEATAS